MIRFEKALKPYIRKLKIRGKVFCLIRLTIFATMQSKRPFNL